MWFIALLGLGALLIHKNKSRAPKPQYALPPAPQPFAQSSPPQYAPQPQYARQPQMRSPSPNQLSPMTVLCEFIRQQRQPPPMVILCAIAEVEQMGRHDIASDIIRMFVEPTVRAAQGQGQPMPAMPAQSAPMAQQHEPQPAPVSARNGASPGGLSDVQIQAMLDRDPTNFAARIQRGDVIDVEPGPEISHETNTDQRGDDQSHAASSVSGTTIGSMLALPSPIEDVDSIRWNAFCDLLSREEPTFVSARHVGQYRQNKDRLRELAIDPGAIVGSPKAQRLALDRDLADAHVHAREGGLSWYVGRQLAVPGRDDQVPVTLSGVLGVIQAAGLEGAADWLEHFPDRKRFRHTTQAFLRTNGVF